MSRALACLLPNLLSGGGLTAAACDAGENNQG
jgi:hypothetical protein